MKRALNSSLDLIGNTPKIKLQKIVPENAADVWLKYEAVNPTGSYKNRIGNEITKQLGDKIDILCASVGTGGAIMGAWKGLRKAIPKIELVAFEPLQSPLLTTGKGGAHQVEGIGVGFKPPFLDQSVLTEIRAIDQGKAFVMCRQLAHEGGVFCVTSTGLNVVGAIELAKEIGPGKRVVTFACDSGLKYLGTNVYLKKN